MCTHITASNNTEQSCPRHTYTGYWIHILDCFSVSKWWWCNYYHCETKPLSIQVFFLFTSQIQLIFTCNSNGKPEVGLLFLMQTSDHYLIWDTFGVCVIFSLASHTQSLCKRALASSLKALIGELFWKAKRYYYIEYILLGYLQFLSSNSAITVNTCIV